MRKEKRQQKKVNRFNFHNVKKIQQNENILKNKKIKGKTENDLNESEEEMLDDEEIPSSEDEVVVKKKPEDKLQKFLMREKKEHDEYFKDIKKNRVDQLITANEEEDKVIAKYEKLLKLNRRKKKDAGYAIGKFNDGLDYLLELCTDDSIQKMYQAAKEADDENFDEEVPVERKKRKIKKKHTMSDNDDESDGDREELMKKSEKLKKIEEKYFGDEEENFKNYTEGANSSNDDDSCDGNDSELASEIEENQESVLNEENSSNDEEMVSEVEESANENESESEEDTADKKNEDGTWEDIYGRKRDKDGNMVVENVTKYVPPHLRKAALNSIDAEDDPKRKEKLQSLKRQIKGHINRLAEANLHRISIDIESIYNSNPRNDTNTVLSEIIMESLITNVLAKERLVLEHSLLIAVLHANLGSEIGAFFLQMLVEKFDRLYKNIDNLVVENKEIDNIVFLICHFFTFKLFKHTLIYELLEKLITKLSEKRIECVLLVLKSIGFILRKEDPIMLKEFILKSQKLLNTQEGEKNTRVAYMMDILLAIKNNNMTKIPQYDATLVDHFRKLLKQFVRPGNYVTTLVITMDDLLNTEERGKWWLVGSAWAGNDSSDKKISNESTIIHDEHREKIFALAKKQRMNTDAKRNVFYFLMTAEDYVDAFEKIISSSTDERTIVTVILHCCLSEKTYNEYYSVLATKFCAHNRKYLLAFQFAVWDRVKELDNLSNTQINNLSRFLIHLIENDNLPLSVLKVVEFAQIEKSSLRFLRQVMLGLLLTSENKFHKIFEKIVPSSKLNSFKDQLRLFLKVFLMKDDKLKIAEDQMNLLKARLHLAEKFLSSKYL